MSQFRLHPDPALVALLAILQEDCKEDFYHTKVWILRFFKSGKPEKKNEILK